VQLSEDFQIALLMIFKGNYILRKEITIERKTVKAGDFRQFFEFEKTGKVIIIID